MLLRKKNHQENIGYQYAYTEDVLGSNAILFSASLHLIIKLRIKKKSKQNYTSGDSKLWHMGQICPPLFFVK